jgi:hypothetical protein
MIDTYFGQVACSDDVMNAWAAAVAPAQVGRPVAR